MEALHTCIPTVSSKPSHSILDELIGVAMVASLLIFIIKSESENHRFNDKLNENQ